MDLNHSELGKSTQYPEKYAPQLLFALPRNKSREGLQHGNLLQGCCGQDIWTAYELSWLNPKGKPQAAVASFSFDPESPCLIESKSFKLYLNSLNQHRIGSIQELQRLLEKDLGEASGGAVKVRVESVADFQELAAFKMPGENLDERDIEIFQYHYDPELLQIASEDESLQVFHSHLLKSNCPVTGQPDWASVLIACRGSTICADSLLRYIVSFRNHSGFHENCVEQIYCDLQGVARPADLFVWARYTRRGGLDINPWRASSAEFADQYLNSDVLRIRLARQ